MKHTTTRNMEYLIFGLLISPSIYACLIFSRYIHGSFFFVFFFFCFSIRSLRNIRSQLFFSRFLLFPAFCTSFSLPPFILATIFCSSTRGRSFILPSSCLLDGTSPHPLSLFSQTLSLYVFRRFHSNLYTFADSFSRCILAFHPFCHSYPFSYFSLLLYFLPF